MLIKMPTIIGDGRLDTIIKVLHLMHTRPNNLNKIILDWKKTNMVIPAGHALFATMFDTKVIGKVFLENINVSTELAKLTSFKRFQNKYDSHIFPPSEYWNIYGKQFFLKAVDKSLSLLLRDDLERCFPDLDEDILYDSLLILNELMQNSLDHSGADRYYIYAGKYEKEIHFGLLDAGVGIPTKLSKEYKGENDLEYLLMSLREGLGTRHIRTGGIGLFNVYAWLKSNKGRFVLISGNAQYRKYFGTRRSQKNLMNYEVYGTWLMLRLPWRSNHG